MPEVSNIESTSNHPFSLFTPNSLLELPQDSAEENKLLSNLQNGLLYCFRRILFTAFLRLSSIFLLHNQLFQLEQSWTWDLYPSRQQLLI